jgi:hypothetical protein
VRCKPDVNEWRGGLAHLYPALGWSVCAPGHHGYPRAPDLILRKALTGRYYPRNFVPICTLGIGTQQAQVRHQILLCLPEMQVQETPRHGLSGTHPFNDRR